MTDDSAGDPPGLRETLAGDANAWGMNGLSASLVFASLLGISKFSVVLYFRLSSKLAHGRRTGALSRLLRRFNSILNDCEISEYATIGSGLHIPHPSGVVIGPASIGRRLTVMQNSTIGMRSRGADLFDPRNFPVLEDDVVIGPGACVLGSVTLGDGVQVGANAVVLVDVPAHHLAIGNPATIRQRSESFTPRD